MTSPADLTEARRLLGAGMKLVKLKPYLKEPEGLEWNKHPISEIDPTATGYGLILPANKLCSVDPDNVGPARIGLQALGFDLDEIMNAGVRTRSTRKNSGGRSAFAAEGDLDRLIFSSSEFGTVLELRANQANLQDAVPGVVYRDKTDGSLCTQQYANGKKLDEAPPLPDALYAWWKRCSEDVEFFREQQRQFFAAIGTTGNLAISSGIGQKITLAFPAAGYRGAYNRAHAVEELLERHGYSWHGRIKRWSCPTASGAPGIYEVAGKPGLWRSDHASDPLHGAFDAWSAFVVLDHRGDVEAAKQACKEAGIYGNEIDFSENVPPIDEIARQDGIPRAGDHPGFQEHKIVFRPLHELLAKPTQVEWLLRGILERRVITLVAGKRGGFKSFLVLHWLLTLARAGVPVFIVSAEGAGLSRRIEAWLKVHAPNVDPKSLPLYVHEQRVDFNDPVALVAVRAAIEASGMQPEVLAIDTFSKNSGGLDENSNTEVKAFIGGLDQGLKTPLDLSIILVAHTGHGDQTRVRGASAIEADTDAALIVNRIGTEHVVSVDRNRFKDAPEMPPLIYQADEVSLGRVDDEGQPVTSLVMREADADAARSVNSKAPIGRAQRDILRACLNRQKESKDTLFWSVEELRGIGRDLGQHRNTARDAVIGLATGGFLTPVAGGGYRLSDGAK